MEVQEEIVHTKLCPLMMFYSLLEASELLCDLGDYNRIQIEKDMIAALKEGFYKAQILMCQLNMASTL
jgi:hypothetical protein